MITNSDLGLLMPLMGPFTGRSAAQVPDIATRSRAQLATVRPCDIAAADAQLVAWCLVADHRGKPRLFRADRIITASVVGEPVQRRPGAGLASGLVNNFGGNICHDIVKLRWPW